MKIQFNMDFNITSRRFDVSGQEKKTLGTEILFGKIACALRLKSYVSINLLLETCLPLWRLGYLAVIASYYIYVTLHFLK